MTEERILNRVKESFQFTPHIDPSQYASFIFFMVKSGMVLFDDTQIDSHLLSGLIEKEIVKYDANGFHQLEACIRYKFRGYKYPVKWNRAVPPKLRKEILERDNYRCQECGESRNLHIDHIVPFSWGGYTEPHNLQVLCMPCNLRKKNK